MSPATDTAITVAAFVVSAPLVIFFGLPFGVFTAGVAMDQQQARPGRIDALQRAAALAVPPLLLFGIYLTAVVLAARASGPTFYYPLIAVPSVSQPGTRPSSDSANGSSTPAWPDHPSKTLRPHCAALSPPRRSTPRNRR